MGQAPSGGQEVKQHRVIYLAGYEGRVVLLVDGQMVYEGDSVPAWVWLTVIRNVAPGTFTSGASGLDIERINDEIQYEQRRHS